MESILHEMPLGKIHDLNMMKHSKVLQGVAKCKICDVGGGNERKKSF